MSDENKRIVREVYQTIGRGDLDRLGELISDDVVEHEEFPGLEPNKEGVLQFFAYMRTAFPDVTMTADDLIAEGDKVSVRGTMSGTHEGEFLEIPATGNQVTVAFTDFFRLEDGRIAEHWGLTDTESLLRQLGVLEG